MDPDRESETPSTPSAEASPGRPPAEAADSPSPAPAEGAASVATAGDDAPSAPAISAEDAPSEPPRIETPPTGIRTGTAPRAVLRPVPEGFPTPPPRPAVPNRRPAKRQDPEAPARPRGPIITALVVVAVLVLVVAIGGSVLVVRALRGADDEAAAPAGTSAPAPGTDPGTGSDPAAAGDVTSLGDIDVTVASVERGVEFVGKDNTRLDADGEFVIVTLVVDNRTDRSVSLRAAADLVTEDGVRYEPDTEAGNVHLADSEPWALLPDGESVQVHYVYDLPIGATPVELEIDLSENPDGGEGTVPLPR